MADKPQKKKKVTFDEVLVSAIATNDALAKLLIAKGIITEEEFNAQVKIEWARYLAA
jgi:phosphohistidine swiveling domain-containing protein